MGISDQTNLGYSFDQLIVYSFMRYRGILMERREGYFLCLGRPCKTLWDCDKVIDGGLTSIEQSIKKPPEDNREAK